MTGQRPVRRRRIAGERAPAAASPAPVPAPAPRPAVARRRTAPPPPEPTVPPRPPEPAAGVQPSVAAPRREPVPWWRVAVAAIAALILAGGVFLGWRGLEEVRGDDGLASSQRAASQAAASAAETIFSYRYDALDDHLVESKALMTAGFAKKFDAIAPALTELAPQRRVVVEAVARNAAAVDCGERCSTDRATILVFVDQARLLGASTEPTVFGNRIEVSMVLRDATWLVDDIRAL